MPDGSVPAACRWPSSQSVWCATTMIGCCCLCVLLRPMLSGTAPPVGSCQAGSNSCFCNRQMHGCYTSIAFIHGVFIRHTTWQPCCCTAIVAHMWYVLSLCLNPARLVCLCSMWRLCSSKLCAQPLHTRLHGAGVVDCIVHRHVYGGCTVLPYFLACLARCE